MPNPLYDRKKQQAEIDAIHRMRDQSGSTNAEYDELQYSSHNDLKKQQAEVDAIDRMLDENRPTNVKCSELHLHLGFSEVFLRPDANQVRDLENWVMELDDSFILRYVYRNLCPRRHLEFGTWQGQGTEYCLNECDATVWTINLLEGERRPDGTGAMYGPGMSSPLELQNWASQNDLRDIKQTDSLGFVGWRYLAQNHGNRVCQIYCDSRTWDINNYPPDFFDSVLIDGGHTEEIVLSDTEKALRLLHSGGIIMWHDFCPKKRVYSVRESTRGVIKAILREWKSISEDMREIFWIDPSWLLLGIKK
jgi:predicted O-methyltransferase YrrM